MQTDDVRTKEAPVRASKKFDGWREREEARAARVAPRAKTASDALIRC